MNPMNKKADYDTVKNTVSKVTAVSKDSTTASGSISKDSREPSSEANTKSENSV